MKRLLSSLLLCSLVNIAVAQLNMTLKSQFTYGVNLTDIWGYNAPDGREYALVGTRTGLSIVDITNTSSPIERAFISGPTSTWRDIKVWDDHAYVTNESGSGLLVVDLSNLPGSITSSDYYYYDPAGLGITTCHDLFIDEFGFAYLIGCSGNSGGAIIFNVFTDPHNPVHVGYGPATYSHDSYAWNNKLYDANIYAGTFSVSDVTDKSNPVLLASQSTPYDFTHNVWLSDDKNTIFTTDERANAPVAAYDISDLNNIELLDEFRPLSTINTGVIPHNVYVENDWLVISHYTSGVVVVDAARPHNLIEVANYDTYAGPNTGYNGVWGVFPFFNSQTVVASDIGNGLHVFEPTYVRAAYLEGTVTSGTTGLPLNGVDISINSSDLNEGTSGLLGDYATGQVSAGTFDVTYSKAGYLSQTISVTFVNGQLVIEDVQLFPYVSVAAKTFLNGCYNSGTGLMDDGIRNNGLIPLTEPYTALGYSNVIGGGETTTASVLSVTGNNAIVDWIRLELRDKTDNTIVLATRSALLQRDGDIVDSKDGTSPVAIGCPGTDDYYVVIQHRNHLSTMTLSTYSLNSITTSIDFSSGTATYGTNAQYNNSGINVMWSGNGNGDGKVVYIGSGSDLSPITVKVYTDPANVLFDASYPSAGYHVSDYNMDGRTIYVGSGSDISRITIPVYLNPVNTNFDASYPLIEQLP